MILPLLIGAVCIVASVAGTFFVRLGKGRRDKNIMELPCTRDWWSLVLSLLLSSCL